MRESVAQFERRTGDRYAPPAKLRAFGEPLTAREAYPTLFRFPSADAVAALLDGHFSKLAPDANPVAWLASTMAGTGRPGAARAFGVVAMPRPLELGLVHGPVRGSYFTLNRAVTSDAIFWAPPDALKAGFSWDRVRVLGDVERKLGKRYAAARERCRDLLGAYLEELGELQRAGAPVPKRAWSELTADARKRALARAGVRGRWTRR